MTFASPAPPVPDHRGNDRDRPAAAGFHAIVVPVNTRQGQLPAAILHLACRLAAERRAQIALLAFTDIPLWEDMDVDLPDAEEITLRWAAEARALASRYGVGIQVSHRRTRDPAELILAEARRRRAQLILLGATGHRRDTYRALAGDTTTRRVLQQADVCTMFIQSEPAA
jgi:nucleotide-binding universal stress UspA family protein